MSEYIISQNLRDSLIGLLILLQKNSEKTYHKYSGSYTNRLLLDNGKELKLPFLNELQNDLTNLEEVIATDDYDNHYEELLYIAKTYGDIL